MQNIFDNLFAAVGAFVTAKGTALLKDCAFAALVVLAVCAIPGGWWLALIAVVGVLVVLHVVHFNGTAAAPAPIAPSAAPVAPIAPPAPPKAGV